MKNYIKSYIYIIGIILISLIIFTILNYFNVLNGNYFIILIFLSAFISFFVGGFLVGIKADKNGWVSGIKLSTILVLLFLILSLIFKLPIKFEGIIYYLLLIASTTAGSMVGINKKKQD